MQVLENDTVIAFLETKKTQICENGDIMCMHAITILIVRIHHSLEECVCAEMHSVSLQGKITDYWPNCIIQFLVVFADPCEQRSF